MVGSQEHGVSTTIAEVMESTRLISDKDFFVSEPVPGIGRRVDLFIPALSLAVIYDRFKIERGLALEQEGFNVLTLTDPSPEYIQKRLFGAIFKGGKVFDRGVPSEVLETCKGQWKDCDRCSLSIRRRRRLERDEGGGKLIYGERSEIFDKMEVLFVGEAPGITEDEKGIPFCGRTGKLFRRWLDRAGIKQDYFITNAVSCWPERDEHKRDRKPDSKQIGRCRERILDLIELTSPDVVIPVGVVALKSLMGKGMMKDSRGKRQKRLIKRRSGGKVRMLYFKVCAVYHPSWVMRLRGKAVGNKSKLCIEDIQNAVNYARGIKSERL